MMSRFLSLGLLGTLALLGAGCALPPGDGENVSEVEQAVHEACPPTESVLGIDIASYQHPNGATIDWVKVAASRRFVIIKATESTSYTNSYFTKDIQDARSHGMIAGAYHFLQYNVSGVEQANYFLQKIGGGVPNGDLPPMLDVESPTLSGTNVAQRVQIMKDWLDTVEAAIGRKPMIYTGGWYWNSATYMNSPQGFSEYPLAWAAYTAACPKIPDDFSKLAIWQYLGGGGTTPGITGACDQDRFYGTESDLLALANGRRDYQGKSLGLSGQSYPIVSQGAVDVAVGQTVTGWVKLTNTGSQTWKPNEVWLAPIPRDMASPFASPSWKSPTRISTVAADVSPGEVGTFELDLTGSAEGESILSLGWVAEGVTWFADLPKGGGPADGYFAVKVNVTAALPTGSGGAGGGDGGTGGSVSSSSSSVGVGVGGAGGGQGGSGGSAPVGDDAPTGDEDSGCGCRVGGSAPAQGSGTAVALGLAALAAGLRRRRS